MQVPEVLWGFGVNPAKRPSSPDSPQPRIVRMGSEPPQWLRRIAASAVLLAVVGFVIWDSVQRVGWVGMLLCLAGAYATVRAVLWAIDVLDNRE
jgi:hypothetical protein